MPVVVVHLSPLPPSGQRALSACAGPDTPGQASQRAGPLCKIVAPGPSQCLQRGPEPLNSFWCFSLFFYPAYRKHTCVLLLFCFKSALEQAPAFTSLPKPPQAYLSLFFFPLPSSCLISPPPFQLGIRNFSSTAVTLKSLRACLHGELDGGRGGSGSWSSSSVYKLFYIVIIITAKVY